jgi:predicted naringenin-chalcone synthase
MAMLIRGVGSVVPQHSITREEAVALASRNISLSERELKTLPALYRMAGVRKRHSVLLRPRNPSNNGPEYDVLRDPEHEGDLGPHLSERMRIYEERAHPIAHEATTAALGDAGIDPAEVTHLVTVSCSGFFAPGVDVKLIGSLGLRPTVERVHVGFMGCQGALNGLRVADGFSRTRPDAAVLVCAVELCSLHYHYGWDPDKVVANALFADGAAAVAGSAAGDSDWKIRSTGACLIPDSQDAMTWRIRDHGFEMSLSAAVPRLIETHLRPWCESWLRDQGLAIEDIATWAVHPGGPRILSSVRKALSLPDGALDMSQGVLRDFGNMSSPTILFILDRLRRASAPLPCIALAFGPGLMAEAILFDS